MAERDTSDLALAAAFRAYLDDAPTDVQSAELARLFATTYPQRRAWIDRWGFRLAPAMTWAVLLVGLLLALVVGSLAAGAFLREDRNVVKPADTAPTKIEVLPAGPVGTTRLVAISRDELWAISGQSVWHFRDGAWTSEEIGADRIVGPNPGPNENVTLAPDGTVWAAGGGGVAYRLDGRWVIADTHAATVVAVDRNGIAWVAGTTRSCDVWSLRPSGIGWTRTSAECPFRFDGGYVTSMALDGRGTLWVGAQGFVVDGLARYAEGRKNADGRWEAIDARDGLPSNLGVQILGLSATGDVWVDFQSASSLGHAVARFDGTSWTVVTASGARDPAVAVAPDGPAWAAALARYDGLGWSYPYLGIAPPLTPLVVAPDGTVFAEDADGSLVRLPAPSASP